MWHCHIDTSTPDERVWSLVQPYIQEYDAAVFTAPAQLKDLMRERYWKVTPRD